MITIKDVALRAGVSTGTVSKVLKNYPDISESTRERVMATIRELGYIPNSAASTLSSKGNKKIAIYIYMNDGSQQSDEVSMDFLMGALDGSRELKQSVITVFRNSFSEMKKESCETYIHSLSVDAVAVFGLNKDNEKIRYLINNSDLKFVVLDADIVRENCSCIHADQGRAQYDVADQAISPGDRVVYLKGKDNGYITDMRMEGIKKLMEDKNIDITVIDGEFSELKAYQEALKFVDDYDVAICANDLMALGVRKAAREKNKHMVITGFDGIRLLGYAGPDILTVNQDFYAMGRMAVEECMYLRKGGKGRRTIIPYEVKTISYLSVIQ